MLLLRGVVGLLALAPLPALSATTGSRRRLSESDAARRMARAHRLLQEPEDFSLTLQDFKKYLDSDVDAEFGFDAEAAEAVIEAAVQRWVDYAEWEYGLAVEAEEAYYAGAENMEKSDIMYAYLVCATDPDGLAEPRSAFGRKLAVYEYILANLADLSPEAQADMQDDAHMKNATDALETVYNGELLTCVFGRFRASVIALINDMAETAVIPLNSPLKIRKGVVAEILLSAYPELGEIDDMDDEDGSNLEADSALGANPNATDGGLEVVLCAGVTQTELTRLGDKVKAFMTRKAANGKSYASQIGPYANLTDAQLDDMAYPARIKLWRKAFELGIDNPDGGCDDFISRVTSTVVGNQTSEGESAAVRLTLQESEGDDTTTDADVACTLGLVMGVSLLPQVCSVEVSHEVRTMHNSEAQWLVQGGTKKSTGILTSDTTRPFWEVGVNGTGQVVAISDSGIDVDHCYFWDDVVGMNPNGGYDMARRKVIQYDPFVDTVDEAGGHGTHVAGTVAGHRAVDGKTESNGTEDGVARAARIAFVDCGRYCGEGCGSLSIPPTDHLMSTGRAGGARLHSASWGSSFVRSGAPYRYDTQARNMDSWLFSNWDTLFIVAAGNDGRSGKFSVGSPAIAKNGLTVGAGYTTEGNTWGEDYVVDFSSEGPSPYSTILPHVVGPGVSILSSQAIPSQEGECEPEAPDALIYMSGTSMATPAVSGGAALVRQYFQDGYYPTGARNTSSAASIDISGTLVKAVILNSGQLMTAKVRFGTVDSTFYDHIQGYGRVSLADTLRIQGHNDIVARAIDRVTVNDQQSLTYQVTVNTTVCTGKELRATLVWADPPGASGCVVCTINDLDLTLINDQTGQEYFPNGLGAKDGLNNAERVIVPASDVVDGHVWTARVRAANLDRSSQQFSLIMSGCFLFDGIEGDMGFAAPPGAAPPGLRAGAALVAAALSAAFLLLF